MRSSKAGAFRLFACPYENYRLLDVAEVVSVGREVGKFALIWSLGTARFEEEIDMAARRVAGTPLVLVLPNSRRLARVRKMLLEAVERTLPHSILPHGSIPDPSEMLAVVRREPGRLPEEVTDYLTWRGLKLDREIRELVRRTIKLAPHVSSLEDLARHVFLSRRALGRRFSRVGLPVPSHWLQMARLLWACVRLQDNARSISRVANSLGYPDAFTLSNQMVRVVGFRPSEVRDMVGWEWVVEAWLKRERENEALSMAWVERGRPAAASREPAPQLEKICIRGRLH